MKKAMLTLAILALVGCARPYGPTTSIINDQVVTPNPSKKQTKIKVFRMKQFRESILSSCQFMIEIDGKMVAMLKQNQYVTAYVDNGTHYLGFSDTCYSTEITGRKVLEVIADGAPQEYSTKIGAYGAFLMWRTQ